MVTVTTHELKTWPEQFASILAQTKTHEIRHDDRAFAVGDVLHLREWNPNTQAYTDREVKVEVTYKTLGGEGEIPPHLCVLSIRLSEVLFPYGWERVYQNIDTDLAISLAEQTRSVDWNVRYPPGTRVQIDTHFNGIAEGSVGETYGGAVFCNKFYEVPCIFDGVRRQVPLVFLHEVTQP